MSDYPLEILAEFIEIDDQKIGAVIRCPNCGEGGSVFFANSIPGDQNRRPTGPNWQRTGDTFETMSLTPSIQMQGHYHGFAKSGMLSVDSPFSCEKKGLPMAKAKPETDEPISESPSLKKELTALAGEIRNVATAVPTPNVTDSHAHGASLHKIANRLLALAAEL